jgi:hypothetical protein
MQEPSLDGTKSLFADGVITLGEYAFDFCIFAESSYYSMLAVALGYSTYSLNLHEAFENTDITCDGFSFLLHDEI